MKTKYYHTSGTRFKVGDVIGGPGKRVYMTTSPVVHSTIWEAVMNGYPNWQSYSTALCQVIDSYFAELDKFDAGLLEERPVRNPVPNKKMKTWVYEVKPFRKPYFRSANEEYIAEDQFVEVVKIIGSGRGILENQFRKFGKYSAKAYHFGGKAIFKY